MFSTKFEGGSKYFSPFNLGLFQTSNFTCAKSNANEKNLLFSLICIRFGTCKVRRLKRALLVYGNWHRHATQFVPGPVRFDQNGMDFATEISLCKTPVVDEKMLILQ